MENGLPKTTCNIPMPSYVKASGKAEKCSSFLHRGVCAFSKEFEKFNEEIKEKNKLLEYQHFTVNTNCGFYIPESNTR